MTRLSRMGIFSCIHLAMIFSHFLIMIMARIKLSWQFTGGDGLWMMRCTDTGQSCDNDMSSPMTQDTNDSYDVFERLVGRYGIRFENPPELAAGDCATIMDTYCVPTEEFHNVLPFSAFGHFRFSETFDIGMCFEIACAVTKIQNTIKTIKNLCGMSEEESDEEKKHQTQRKESSDDNLGTDLITDHCPYPLQLVSFIHSAEL